MSEIEKKKEQEFQMYHQDIKIVKFTTYCLMIIVSFMLIIIWLGLK